jgi:hypothetical protein
MNTQAMALPKRLRQFYRTIRTNRPHLTKPQAKTLALWSDAILHTGTCGLTTVATYAALLLRQPQNTRRQRLREFYKDAAHKAGTQRRELDITPCFAALLRWIVRLWTPPHKCLALALYQSPSQSSQKTAVDNPLLKVPPASRGNPDVCHFEQA